MDETGRKSRQRPWKAKTLSARRADGNVHLLVVEYPDVERPKTRGDCVDGPRPCPFVSCRYHLFLEAKANGSIHLAFGSAEVDEIPETCSLDAADRREHTLLEVGDLIGLTKERTRQIQDAALAKVGDLRMVRELATYWVERC